MNLYDILMASKIAENSTDSADFVQKNDVSAVMQEYGINSETLISEIENQSAENTCTLDSSSSESPSDKNTLEKFLNTF